MAKYGAIRGRRYPAPPRSAVHIGELFKISLCGQSFVHPEAVGEPTCKTCIKAKRARDEKIKP